MHTTTRAAAGPRQRALSRLALLGAVAVVVLGIFAMHALNLHGTAVTESHLMAAALTTPADEAMSQPEHGSPHGAAQHGSQPVAQQADLEASDPSVSASGDAGGGMGGMGDMAMLCVAMLAAAAGTLLLLLTLTRRAPPTWTAARTGVTVRVADWLLPTGTGPPSAWKFSVIRC